MRDIIKTSVIRVDNLAQPEKSFKIETDLNRLLGVTTVNADSSSGKVTITYNLKFINFNDIETKLKNIGFPPSDGIFRKIKRGFIKFTEKNEIEGHKINYGYPPESHGKALKN